MVPVVVPRKYAGQGTFPAARAKFDGYGVGMATWARLKALQVAAAAAANGGGGSSSR